MEAGMKAIAEALTAVVLALWLGVPGVDAALISQALWRWGRWRF